MEERKPRSRKNGWSFRAFTEDSNVEQNPNSGDVESRDYVHSSSEIKPLLNINPRKFMSEYQISMCAFSFISSIHVANMIISWLYYQDVLHIEKGLVQGPPGNTVKHSLLVFTIFGSTAVVFEIFNLWRKSFSNNPWLDTILSSAITVWTEDVTQLVIIFFISASREEAVGYSQFLKAAIVILSVAVRILYVYIRNFYKQKDAKKSCLYVIFLAIGIVVSFSAAISVFINTRLVTNVDAGSNAKYFQNTGVFFSFQTTDYPNQPPYCDPNMVKLVDVDTIIKTDPGLVVTLNDYEGDGIAISVSNINGTLIHMDEYFEVDNETLNITSDSYETLNISSNCTSLITPTNRLVFLFTYTKPKLPYVVYGEITFNVIQQNCSTNYGSSCSCSDPRFSIGDNIPQRNITSDSAIQYFRYIPTKYNVSTVEPTMYPDAVYYNASLLQDVTSLWTSGFAVSQTSGTVAPTLDQSLFIPCIPQHHRFSDITC